MRLDLHISETRKISRNRARFLIEEGLVSVNGKIVKKSAFEVDSANADTVEIAEDPRTDYVARSAVKLEKFLSAEKLRPEGKKCLDVGSSTGGFVQVLLAGGATAVVAVDVGSDQLHPSLRDDPRIELHENTDVRHFYGDETDGTPETFEFVTADLSFIPLEKVLPDLVRLAAPDAWLVLLFKPQFEVGKSNLTGKSYVARDQNVALAAAEKFATMAESAGLSKISFRESELPGEAGNREYFFLFRKRLSE